MANMPPLNHGQLILSTLIWDGTLERGGGKDRDDADYLFRSQKLDAKLLRERYEKELRHNLIGNVEWHDGTLKLWIEIFEAPR